MNAVCSICNDGDVTSDNQIIFCDACNVAVHQMCYGIDEVPEGDYFCFACRHFKRDKIVQRQAPDAARNRVFPPLPMSCELCPVKHGAYTRTDTSKSAPNSSIVKWVHTTCAKWQGLDFLVKGKADLVEDVGELKEHFLRSGISCAICQGQRGAYNKCRFDGCQKWIHVSCARASGICEVIHGEDVDGPVTDNPWTLLCPDHSNVSKVDTEGKAKGIPIAMLIQASKEFPPEPIPPPLPQTFKPFNKLSAEERVLALSNRKYEDEVIEELLCKKWAGVRCEVCDVVDDDNISPEVTLRYQLADDISVFAAYKTGFKSGGIDVSALPTASLDVSRQTGDFSDIIFASEESEGFEAGIKSELFGRQLRLNVTAYRYE